MGLAEVAPSQPEAQVIIPPSTEATAPAPVPAARVDFLQRAVDLEQTARDLEAKGFNEPALKTYTDCLQLLAYVQKKEENPRVKEKVRDRMAELLDRAEV